MRPTPVPSQKEQAELAGLLERMSTIEQDDKTDENIPTPEKLKEYVFNDHKTRLIQRMKDAYANGEPFMIFACDPQNRDRLAEMCAKHYKVYKVEREDQHMFILVLHQAKFDALYVKSQYLRDLIKTDVKSE
jgi:hypothetical protein